MSYRAEVFWTMNADDRTEHLLSQHRGGGPEAWNRLIGRYREILKRQVEPRLHGGLRQRLDASDVVQEVCLEATRRIPEYLEQRDMPFGAWMRFLANQKVLEVERRHLGAGKRDLRKERALEGQNPGQTAGFDPSDGGPAPDAEAKRFEVMRRLEAALGTLSAPDREMIRLRNDEGKSNLEVADLLELDPSAASKRYLRALKRLRDALGSSDHPESLF